MKSAGKATAGGAVMRGPKGGSYRLVGGKKVYEGKKTAPKKEGGRIGAHVLAQPAHGTAKPAHEHEFHKQLGEAITKHLHEHTFAHIKDHTDRHHAVKMHKMKIVFNSKPKEEQARIVKRIGGG